MDKRLELLEKYRTENGLKHADIARLLGANSIQAYNNWRYRGSMPKEYFPMADKIIASDKETSPEEMDLLRKFSELSDAKKKAAALFLDTLLQE